MSMTRMVLSHRKSVKHQKGVVMIMALLIVALVTTIVVSVTWRFELSMARNENRWHGAQARAYLEAAEMLACLGLQADFLMEAATGTAPAENLDHLGEDWAMPGQPYPVDEGWVKGDVEDAHSRINLNLLIPPLDDNDPKTPPVPYSATQERFIRLLQLIELEGGVFIDESAAKEIVDAIQDWLDRDSRVSGYGGAEASFYESLVPPYPIADGEMTSISELSMIKGITPELYSKLVPYVIALPGVEGAANGAAQLKVELNINTMKPILLRTLNRKGNLQPLLEAEWAMLLTLRGDPLPAEFSSSGGAASNDGMVAAGNIGFKSVKDFAALPEVEAILGDNKQFDTDGLVVQSQYFLLKTETLVGEQIRRGKAVLFRDINAQGLTTVIRRTDANY